MASESHKGLIFKFEERGIARANNARGKHYNGQVGAPCSQIQEMRLHPTWSQTTILTGINRDCWFRALVITRCRNTITISIEFERGAYTNSLNSFSTTFSTVEFWKLKNIAYPGVENTDLWQVGVTMKGKKMEESCRISCDSWNSEFVIPDSKPITIRVQNIYHGMFCVQRKVCIKEVFFLD